MFKIDDFWEIFKAVRDDADADVSDVLDAIAKSERATSQQFFENRFDQAAYATEDYKRLREFLIDWNAAHRTINTAERKASTDAFSMTEESLDEMFRSFGFNFSSGILSLETGLNLNKINFLLDLVNLYKIKGTPESIVSALEYYGITNIDLIEYFLKKDEKGEIIFDGNKITGSGEAFLDFIDRRISFEEMTGNDPHWMTTLSNLNTLIPQNKIGLPTKSPYFSLRSSILLSEIYKPIAILSRVVQDQYDEWQSSGELPTQDASLSLLGKTVSLLELYVSFIYVYNYYYDYGTTGLDDFWCYDGTSFDYTEVTHIDNEYDSYRNHEPTSRADQKQQISEFFDLFTRKRSSHFLQNKNSASILLDTLNPSLKAELGLVLDTYPKLDLIGPFVVDIDNWLKVNVDEKFANIAYYMFGTNSVTGNIDGVINFFKPYRARLRSFDNILIYNNRLTETIKVYDSMEYNVTENPIDTLSVTDELIKLIVRDFIYTIYVCRNENTLGHMMTDDDILTSIDGVTQYSDSTSTQTIGGWTSEALTLFQFPIASDIREMITYGGFVDFDQPGGFYDCTPANDIVNVQLTKDVDTLFPLKNDLIAAEADGEYILDFTRDSIATEFDFYNINRYIKSGEARFGGARRVENLLDYCDDLSAPVWIKTGNVQTPDRNTIVLPPHIDGTTTNEIYQVYNFDEVQNRTFTGRIKIPATTGWDSTSAILFMSLHDDMIPIEIGAIGNEYVFSMTFTNMSYTPTAPQSQLVPDGTGFTLVTFGLPFDSTSEIHIDTTDQIKFKIWSDSQVTLTGIGEAQLEDVTGQQNFISAEYAATRKYVYPYYGSGADGVRWFDFKNRNYIEGNLITWSEQIGKTIADGYPNSGWFTTDSTSSSTLHLDPNDELTAVEIDFGVYGTSYIGTSNDVFITNEDYIFSFYVKQIDASDLNYRVYDVDNDIDLVPETSYISQVSTSDWIRIEVLFTPTNPPSGYTSNIKFYLHSGDTAGSVIFWGTQVNKGISARTYYKTEQNIIPGILIDARGTKTFILDTTLKGIHIENTKQNLLIDSNEFWKPSWTKSASTEVQNNIDFGIDGRLNSSRLHSIGSFEISQVVSCDPNTKYNFSVWAKRALTNSDEIRLNIIGTDSTGSIFDLSLLGGLERIDVSGTTDSTTTSIEVKIDYPVDRYFRYETDFSEYSNGDITAQNWTEQWNGGNESWTVENGSGIGDKQLDVVTGSNAYRLLTWDNVPTLEEDIEVLIKFRSITGVQNIQPLAIVRGSGSVSNKNGYYVYPGASGGAIKKFVADSDILLDTWSSSYSVDTWYWIRFRVTGNVNPRVQAKVWQDGTSEPSSWNVDYYDSTSQIIVGGYAGIGGYGTNHHYEVDYFGTGIVERVIITSAQLEEGNHPSSYIPTDSTSVIRLLDDLRVASSDNIENEFSMSYKVTPDKNGSLYINDSTSDISELRFVCSNDTRSYNYEFRTIKSTGYDIVPTPSGGGYQLHIDEDEVLKDTRTLYQITHGQDGTDVQTVLFVDGVQKLNMIDQFTLDHSNSEIEIGNYNATDYTFAYFRDISIWNRYYTFGNTMQAPTLTSTDSTSIAEIYLQWGDDSFQNPPNQSYAPPPPPPPPYMSESGTYAGDGGATQDIDLGFDPDLIFIVADVGGFTNVAFKSRDAHSGTIACGGGMYQIATQLEFITDGFRAHGSSNMNFSGKTYFYFAMKNIGGIYTHDTYTGDGNDDRVVPLAATPGMVLVTRGNTGSSQSGIYAWADMLATSSYGCAGISTPSANFTNHIQNVGPGDQFELGTDGRGNTDTIPYDAHIFAQIADRFEFGHYTGDGNDDRQVNVSFEPKMVVAISEALGAAFFKTPEMASGESHEWYNSFNRVNMIKTINANGFTVGTSTMINGTTAQDEYYWFAFA